MPVLRTRDLHVHSLDVTTDAPARDSVPLHSPTPRQFQFPKTHALSTDSPSSSPSSSPFEADRPQFCFTNPFAPVGHAGFGPVAIPTPPPFLPQPLTGRRTPDSMRSSSPSPSMHKRRKSSCSSESERRPKKGDDDYIKRPENAFILFRRKCCEDRNAAQEELAHLEGPQKKQRQADLSKSISQQWKSLPAEEKQYWENLAKEKKKEHEAMYPNYVYRPQRQKDKDGRSKNKKSMSKRGREDDSKDANGSVAFMLPVAPRHYGHPLSAPTPPPYQSIVVPHVAHVHHLLPSAPVSPTSLVPLIAKQSSGSIDSNNFDFLPPQSYVPPPFSQNMNMDLSSEFFGNMYPAPNQSQPRKLGMSPLEQLAMAHNASTSTSSSSSLVPQPLSLDTGISPASSISSGSSGPPSPTTGPFTPSSAPLDPSAFLEMAAHVNLDLFDFNAGVTQAELDLQAEMQLQNDYSQYSWNHWGDSTLDNNWDVNSIPSALLGEQMPPKFDNMCVTGLEFGNDFAQALDGGYTENPLMHAGGYDDLLAGNAFAAAA